MKRRQYNRSEFLIKHPVCCYCEKPATTTDHCPPRVLFYGRLWPEGFEFPACHHCNQKGRRFEQVAALMHRFSLAPDSVGPREEFQKLVNGVRNNAPEVFAEWQMSRNEIRNSLRERFGPELGDNLRYQSYGAITLGQHTLHILRDFSRKLAKALYYKFRGRRFIGQFTTRLMDFTGKDLDAELQRLTPHIAISGRGKYDLQNQFSLRFNHNAESGVFMGVVSFAGCLGYFILMVSDEFFRIIETTEEGRAQTADLKAFLADTDFGMISPETPAI